RRPVPAAVHQQHRRALLRGGAAARARPAPAAGRRRRRLALRHPAGARAPLLVDPSPLRVTKTALEELDLLKRWIAAALLCTLALWPAPLRAQDGPAPQAVRIYVGTQTSAGGEGIYQLRLDLASGALSSEAPPVRAENPSWLDLHPTLPVLYATTET